MEITRELIKGRVGKIMVCEPYVKAVKEFDLQPLDAVLRESDILVLLVNHKQFYDVDRELLQEKIVIDTRGIWK